MYAQAIELILKDHCSPTAVREVEAGGSPQVLQDAIADAGFLEILASEENGGAEVSLQEFFQVAELCGSYSVPLPLTQTMATRLLVAKNGRLPQGMITFAPALTQIQDGTIVCPLVPCALTASHVMTAKDDGLWILPVAQAQSEPTGIASSLCANLRWEMSAGEHISSEIGARDLQALGAVLHAAMLSGAIRRVFDMTLMYCNDRSQFGKTLGKFQAVQHQLSLMAEHVAAASFAAQAAFQCDRRLPSLVASAVAKSRASEAAQLVASIGHALHGAMGVTAEYDLHLYTRRLHEWRMAHGSEAYWNKSLGESLLASRESLMTDHVRTIAA